MTDTHINRPISTTPCECGHPLSAHPACGCEGSPCPAQMSGDPCGPVEVDEHNPRDPRCDYAPAAIPNPCSCEWLTRDTARILGVGERTWVCEFHRTEARLGELTEAMREELALGGDAESLTVTVRQWLSIDAMGAEAAEALHALHCADPTGPWPTTTQSPPPTRTQIAAMVTASQARALVQSRRGK